MQILVWVTIKTDCNSVSHSRQSNCAALTVSHTRQTNHATYAASHARQTIATYCESHYRQTNHATYALSHARQIIELTVSHTTQISTPTFSKQELWNKIECKEQKECCCHVTLALPLHVYCAVPCLYNRVCQTEYQTNAVLVQHLSP